MWASGRSPWARRSGSASIAASCGAELRASRVAALRVTWAQSGDWSHALEPCPRMGSNSREPEGELMPRKFPIRTLTPTIGAVVEDVDLSKPLAHEEIAEIRAALLAHKVIFFEDQHVTPTEQRDFAARFGALHTHPLYPRVPEAPELFILDNHP